jgi:hypothetical protein
MGPSGQPLHTGEGDDLVGNEAAAKDGDDEDSTREQRMLHCRVEYRDQKRSHLAAL